MTTDSADNTDKASGPRWIIKLGMDSRQIVARFKAERQALAMMAVRRLVEATFFRRQPLGRPGQTLGRYKLLKKIGEGGFGEVWMAEQREPVERRVA